MSPSDSDFDLAVQTIRFLSVDAVEKAASGHPGAPMGQALIAAELFAHHLVYDPEQPQWPNRDRFVLSCGHASMLLYSMLHLTGFGLEIEDLKNFRQWGSRTAGHPELGDAPGIETTTGPLGQGIGNAIGMALAGKVAGARLGKPELLDYTVYALCSDGDLMEGVSYESSSLAGHLKLDNLVAIYDDNGITIDGSTELSFGEDVEQRFLAMGWQVQRVNGLDVGEVATALKKARAADRPALIIARTQIGYGAPTKQGTAGSHGAPLGPDEVRATKEAAGWPLEPTFHVPEKARQVFEPGKARGRAKREEWKAKVEALDAEVRSRLDAFIERRAPENLLERLIEAAGDKTDATRSHSGRLLQVVAETCPALVGGSSDLNASVKTAIKESPTVKASDYAGRNISFGIREHGMASILNGMALSGLVTPLGSTFLIFGDYMRPPMRLAALMRQQIIYVLTHDSVFLGEDGPTHQPVEQLWTMRMVPHLDVVRPADAVECAAAWTYAMTRTDGPTVLSLTRHKVPALERPEGFSPSSMLDGAYVLSDDKDPELVLIATGSEVSVAAQAKQLLAQQGRRIRVVSMPCVDAFLRLPKDKQEAILPPGVRRASLELSVTLPWRAIVGTDGICIGVDRFGASAPWEVIQEKFQVDPKSVARRISEELG